MQRVVVLGSVGAGKSTLARELSTGTNLPVVHLDQFFWRAGWTPAPRDGARRELAEAAAGQRWILDGNFLSDRDDGWDERFERADTVVFLDLPRRTCMRRVFGRVLRDRGVRRSDLPEGCEEGLGLDVIRWIWSYPKQERPRVLRLLDRLEGRAAVYRLRSPTDVERFLRGRDQDNAGGR